MSANNNPAVAASLSQAKAVYDRLQGQIDALVLIVRDFHDVITPSATSWADVQAIVRAGLADKAFPVGTKMYCHRGNDILEWDVIGVDHDTPADPQFTHSLTLQLHDCFPATMQFDAPEAFYYCGSALEAKTYYFTVNGTNYQFTMESDIEAGSQLILNFTDNTPTNIFVSAAVGGDFVKDTNDTDNLTIAVTAGSGGTPLNDDYINDINRVRYGSNNYKESAIRQWLNKSAAAGSVWTAQNNFDRPPEWHTGNKAIAGFMNGMDADFIAAIGKTHIVVARNTATDGGGFDEMDDYFFLPSRSEVYGGVEANNVNEGEPYPCYSDYSDLGNTAGTGEDSNRIKYKINDESGLAQSWWNRTPSSLGSSGVRYATAKGAVAVNYAYLNGGVAPACNVI